MEIVINKCYGGFGLSTQAMIELVKLNSSCLSKSKKEEWKSQYNKVEKYGNYEKFSMYDDIIIVGDDVYSFEDDYPNKKNRSNNDLIKVVKELGEDKASGKFSKLRIIEVPDDIDYEIEDYDGIETIHEKHRSW